jgi:3-deoxy-D-manno-octulosonic-acid transferase
VDTLGELAAFMARAEIVFMGGSLVPHGGHNILEPARLGKPIVFGPHMDNFADEARIFLEHEAAIQITDDDALDRCLARLLESREERDQLGERAKSVVRQYEDIAERYVDEIAGQCNLSLA